MNGWGLIFLFLSANLLFSDVGDSAKQIFFGLSYVEKKLFKIDSIYT